MLPSNFFSSRLVLAQLLHLADLFCVGEIEFSANINVKNRVKLDVKQFVS
jgi:hypothetical protein